MIYRFLGTSSEIHGVCELRQFGQSVELPDALARDAILGNCPIIPADTFDGIFTADDARRYASPASRLDAPEEFKAKLKTALIALHEWRDQLEQSFFVQVEGRSVLYVPGVSDAEPAPLVTAPKEAK